MRGAIPVGAAVLALLLQGCVNPAPAQNIRIKDNDVTFLKPSPPPPAKTTEDAARPAADAARPAADAARPAADAARPAEASDAQRKEHAPAKAASFAQTGAFSTEEAPYRSRRHGQSWGAVEAEDDRQGQQLQALGGVLEESLDPDPDKVQSQINAAWDLMQAEDRHFLTDQQHHLNLQEARAAFAKPHARSRGKLLNAGGPLETLD